ncbi:hypothetical protein KSP39_PZI019091 [Platanthera zijinensis]|uniref:Uncharacterized protein n=1 Tax=Platanthera zijinensis TaxID=2320716 RepID=A0AAP0B234_9ASPA
MTKVAGPLIRLLRIVDSNEKPSIGYVYDGMYRARKAIKGIFRNVKRLYKPYTTIIKDRWDRQLRQRIHSAAYFLNPAFQYDPANYSNKPKVLQGLIDLIGNKDICNKASVAMNEVRIYREQLESFGKPLAIKMSKEMQPEKSMIMYSVVYIMKENNKKERRLMLSCAWNWNCGIALNQKKSATKMKITV